MLQPLWKIEGRSIKKLRIELPYGPTIPQSGSHQRGWVGCWAAWGTGSPPGAVITPRRLWALQGRAAAPGLPLPSEAHPQAAAGRPRGHSFLQELQAPL